jgi:hypothetical protein
MGSRLTGALLVIALATACSPRSSPPGVSPAIPASLDAARAAIAAGRMSDAAAALDGIIERTPSGRRRADAIELCAYVRLSADPTVRDLPRAKALLTERSTMQPLPAQPMQMAAMLGLLDALTTAEAAARDAEAASSEQGERAIRELRQLRSENATLRNQVRQGQDELKEKEQALRKLASSIVKTNPQP